MKPLYALAAAFASICPTALAADAAAWKSRNIYFVLTDRIARSSTDNGGACSDLGSYCGGTFKGLESKLDYIKGMGFDAIWITPVVSSKPTRSIYNCLVNNHVLRYSKWIPWVLGR